MLTDKVDHRTVRSAIELASHAPSVHNSQPWHWTVGRRVVHLNADLTRWLPATDADGRDLTVSCGAALHHVRVALAAAGIRAAVHRIPNPGEPDRLATLELTSGTPTEADLELAAAITGRRTDRRPFSDWQIPEDSWRELEGAAVGQGAILRMVSGGGPRAALLEAIREADAQQKDVPGYGTELAMWSGRRAGDDGVPAANLLHARAAGIPAARDFPAGDIGPYPLGREDGAVLAVLGTASDDTLSRLRAGRRSARCCSPPRRSAWRPAPSASPSRSARPAGSSATRAGRHPFPSSSFGSAGRRSGRPCPPPPAGPSRHRDGRAGDPHRPRQRS